MYTVYFVITCTYSSFKQYIFAEKTIKDGDRFDPYQDSGLLESIDECVQRGLDDHFGSDTWLDPSSCDLKIQIITEKDYNDVPDLITKIVC